MIVHTFFAELRGNWLNMVEPFVPAIKVGGTPAELVHENEKLGFKLLHYIPQGASDGEKMIIIPHIINRPYLLDIQPEFSIVKRFCEGGFDVFMIDWGYSGAQHPEISFRDYSIYVNEATARMSAKKVSVLGYCTGGIIGLIFASLYPDRIGRVVLLATPVDFSMLEDPRIFLARAIDLSTLGCVMGNIPGELINLFGSALLAWHLPLFSLKPEFVAEYLGRQYQSESWRLTRWLWDAPAVPTRAYFEFVDGCYRHNQLIKGEFRIGSELVKLNRIKCPLLNIAARYDHLVPVESAAALKRVYSGRAYRQIIFPSSHLGLSVGWKAHKDLWPQITGWVKSGKQQDLLEKKTSLKTLSSNR
jgi:polyhydroxyalkanoate synthase